MPLCVIVDALLVEIHALAGAWRKDALLEIPRARVPRETKRFVVAQQNAVFHEVVGRRLLKGRYRDPIARRLATAGSASTSTMRRPRPRFVIRFVAGHAASSLGHERLMEVHAASLRVQNRSQVKIGDFVCLRTYAGPYLRLERVLSRGQIVEIQLL